MTNKDITIKQLEEQKKIEEQQVQSAQPLLV